MSRSPEDLLAELARVADELGPALAPPSHTELLSSITEAAMKIFDARACSLALLDDEQTTLTFWVASGEGADTVVGSSFPASEGIAGWVVTSGQPIEIGDVTKDPRFSQEVAERTGYVPRSILAMPLETERGTLGVLEVLDRGTEGRDSARDMSLIALFANQASLAIENSRVFQNLARVILEAAGRASGRIDVIDALAAIEGRSEEERQLKELARMFADLGRMGDRERAAATEIVRVFLDYAKATRKRW